MSLLAKAEAMLKQRTHSQFTIESRSQASEDAPEASMDLDHLRSYFAQRGKVHTLLIPSGKVLPGLPTRTKETITTSIAGLESLPAGTILLTGSPGSGKTILALQFLMDGLQKGEHVLYLSFEEKKENLANYCKPFGWDLNNDKLTFIRYPPEKALQVLEDLPMLGKHVSRVVIDSLTALTVLCKDALQAQDTLEQLFTLTKGNASMLLLAEEAPVGGSGVTFTTNGAIGLYNVRTGQIRQRVAHVFHARTLMPYSIESTGVALLPDEAQEIS
jgi:KaiC/GvpD/RAD55 family RecA-like ATPase